MKGYRNHYQILGIPEHASINDIKHSFRTLCMKIHLDRNRNSPESTGMFQVILDAYQVLSDDKTRREYDRFIHTSAVIRRQHSTLSIKMIAGDSWNDIISRLNIILWEIEDYLGQNPDTNAISGKRFSAGQYIAMILGFLDRWILEPSGLGDHFMTARQKKKIDPREYVYLFDPGCSIPGYCPYHNITDYFYDIRRRTDKFLNRPGHTAGYRFDDGRYLAETVTEFHTFAIHYLTPLLNKSADIGDDTAPYTYRDKRYAYEYSSTK